MPAARGCPAPGGIRAVLIGAKTIAAFLALIVLGGGQMRGEVAPAPVSASVAVLGDSYAAGAGAKSTHAWEHYTALELGWYLETVRGYPGAGYVNPGGIAPYETMLALDPLPATVSQVIVQGGFNDIAFDPAQVGAAVSRTLALIHQQAPLADVTVVGLFDPGPGNFTDRYPTMPATAAAIQQAVLAAGDRFVDGFAIPYEVGPDRAHPTATGHADLGHAIAGAIRAAVPAEVGRKAGTLTSRAAAVIGVSRVGAYGARYFYTASTRGGRLGAVTEVAFGEAGDVPGLVPDAEGGCAPAVYRPSTGTVHVGSAGGAVEDIPVDGGRGDQLVQNGSSATPGGRAVILWDPVRGRFVGRVPGPEDAVRGTLGLGQRGDRCFVYSVAGAGTTLGVYRPENSTFLIADPSAQTPGDVTSVPFGSPGDQGLVGAWGWSNVDGSDRVGVFRPSTAEWFLAGVRTPLGEAAAFPITAAASFSFGNPGDTALACNPV